jgi:hypothetical protein
MGEAHSLEGPTPADGARGDHVRRNHPSRPSKSAGDVMLDPADPAGSRLRVDSPAGAESSSPPAGDGPGTRPTVIAPPRDC